jgi:hypothetical protein
MPMHTTHCGEALAAIQEGESLMEFLVSLNLNILNHGNEPTLVFCNRREVIDLTLGTNKIVMW